jgi:hypothetical protein
MNNIVLVHGAFVDGSGWEGVYKILRRDENRMGLPQLMQHRLGCSDFKFTCAC